MEDSLKYNLAFMPYAPLDKDVELGNFQITAFDRCQDSVFESSAVRNQLKAYFERYIELKYDRKMDLCEEIPLKIYILAPRGYVLGRDSMSDEQYRDAMTVSHIMAFTSVLENSFMGPGSSEPFFVYLQNFVKGQEGFGYYGTYYMAYKLFKMAKPLYINNHPMCHYDNSDLGKALAKLLTFRNTNSMAEQILRSLELLFHTITIAETVTSEHKLLTLVMAFEVLLGFENRRGFVDIIKNELSPMSDHLEEREISLEGGKKEKATKTLTQWWAYDLYNLRSAIIHGEKIDWQYEKYGDVHKRIEFAGILFRRLYKIFLQRMNLWTSDFTDQLIVEAGCLDEELLHILEREHI